MWNLPEIDQEVASCVYKIYYGDKYLIIKGKTLSGSVYLLQKGYAQFIAGGGGSGNNAAGSGHTEWDGINTYYKQFYQHVHKNNLSFSVRVLLESDNHYDLLKKEQQELNLSIKDKKCLNSNVESYIPKYRKSTKMYGWINRGSVLSFKKFLKRM